MAIVYIIHSKKISTFYVGSCLELATRITAHNTGKFKNSFTKRTNDWKLFLALENLPYKAARKIEAHIKSMKSTLYFYNLKKYPEMRTKLIKKYA